MALSCHSLISIFSQLLNETPSERITLFWSGFIHFFQKMIKVHSTEFNRKKLYLGGFMQFFFRKCEKTFQGIFQEEKGHWGQ